MADFISCLNNVLKDYSETFVTLLLILLGWRQHVWNKRHNNALVLPLITGKIDINSKSVWSFKIVNKGLGTARLNELVITKSGKRLTMKELELWLKASLKHTTPRVAEFNNQYALSPGEELALVEIEGNGANALFDRPVIKELLDTCVVRVEYRSLLSDKPMYYESKNNLSILTY